LRASWKTLGCEQLSGSSGGVERGEKKGGKHGS
jgi:hypothetical protein